MAQPKIRDLKLEDSEKENWGNAVMCEPPDYPYGLRLDLDESALQKMAVNKLPQVGDMVQIAGYARVMAVSVRADEDYDGDDDEDDQLDRGISLQITAMGIAPAAQEDDTSKTLYDNKE